MLDPIAFPERSGTLRELGVDVDGQLFVSNRAQVILPYHRMIELAAESAPGRKKIGTTSRGIGPAYEDKMARSGLRVVDLLQPELLKTHIEAACEEKNAIAHALFGTDPLDPAKMYDEYAAAAEQMRPFVADTGRLLNEILAEGGSVMFEGAQGTMLDIDHGTYPFVTSSSATAGGAATGTGVGPTAIGTVISVTKAYVTRVGEGPFPTEIHDAAGDALAGARQRVRRGDGAAAALRLAGYSAAALLEPGERRGMAGGDQAGRSGRAGGDSGLRRLRDRREGDRRDSRRCAGAGADQAALYHAEGLAPIDRGHYASSTSCPRRRGSTSAFRSGRAGRRSGWFPPARTATRPWCCRSLPKRWRA